MFYAGILKLMQLLYASFEQIKAPCPWDNASRGVPKTYGGVVGVVFLRFGHRWDVRHVFFHYFSIHLHKEDSDS